MYILEVLCALAVALICPNVEALVSKVVYIEGPVKDYDIKILVVQCGSSNCNISKITFENSGGLTTQLWYPYNRYLYAFCSTYKSTTQSSCGPKELPSTKFTIKLYPAHSSDVSEINGPSFHDLKIKVTLENSEISIKELGADGLSIQVDQQTGNNYVRLRSGYEYPAKLPYTEKQVKVTCNGPCGSVRFRLASGKDAILIASKEKPALAHEYGCYNCFCTSNAVGPGNGKICQNQENQEEFDLESNVLYITLVPHTRFTDVTAILEGDNIESVKWYNIWDKYELDGSQVRTNPAIGPIVDGDYIHFEIFCLPGKNCLNVKVRFEPEYKVLKIRAGKNTTVDSNGYCPGCKCDTALLCQVAFDPDPVPNYFYKSVNSSYVTLRLKPDRKHNLGYLEVIGDNIMFVFFGGKGKEDSFPPRT